MKKIYSTLGKRELDLLKLAGSSIRLARADEARVAHNARRYLAESMGRMNGLPHKVCQILSMDDSLEADTFDPLAEASQPLAFPIVEQVLSHEWRRPWQTILRDVQPEGVAGRLGQVHRAQLHSGEEVAVKVQYPGIARAFYNELKAEEWSLKRTTGLGDGIKLARQRKAFLSGLAEELNYLAESENQQQYEILAKYNFVADLVVPIVLNELCTSRVLVSHWEDGNTLEDVAEHWSVPDRQAAARNFLNHALAFFRQGFIHADLDPANFRFRRGEGETVELVAFDFGRLFRPNLSLRLALMRLIEMTATNGNDDPYPLFIKIGFNPHLLEPMAHRLPALCRVLFEPFIADGPYDLKHWQLHKRMSAVLGEHYKRFRSASPPQLHLLFGMLQDLAQVLRQLEVNLCWYEIMGLIFTSFRDKLSALSSDLPELPDRGFRNVANRFVIQVLRDGELESRRSSPLSVIEGLEETMDEPLRSLVEAAKFDFAEMRHHIWKNGYRPNQQFVWQSGEREMRVWLE